jgi:hypothetical protein
MSQQKKIIDEFVKTFSQLLKACEKDVATQTEYMKLDHLKSLYRMCPHEEKFFIAQEKIWPLREMILDRDFDKIIQVDIESLYSDETVDETRELVADLMDILKKKFKTLSLIRRDEYWDFLTKMLQCIAQYKHLTS